MVVRCAKAWIRLKGLQASDCSEDESQSLKNGAVELVL